MTASVVIRPATRADIDDWYGGEYKRSCRAWVIERGGRPACVAGYSFEDGYVLMFSDIRDPEAPKTAIWRGARLVIDHVKRAGLPLLALADPEIQGSGRFLERLGFILQQSTEHGDIYQWQAL
jgi:hypothetical protein